MDLEVRHLRLVEAIASEGGITGASRKLYLTQSALSHQLREIEDRLGTPLFLRVRRTMVLTEAGRCILRSAKSILSELRATEEEVRRLGRGGEGLLRISTQCNTCYHWLPSLIKRFHKDYPGVEVQVNVEATDDPMSALWKGELDLAIVFSLTHQKGLTLFPLFEDELLATMQPGHRLASKEYLRPEDFTDENLIVYAIPREENMIFRKILTPAGISPARVMHVMLTEAIIEMVKAGLGISVLARWFTAPYIRDGLLHAVRVTRKGLMRKWVGATIARQESAPYIAHFAKILAQSSLPVTECSSSRKRTASVQGFYRVS